MNTNSSSIPSSSPHVPDPRIQLLSYSSLLTLHKCPRKFQLNRLKATEDELNPDAAINQNVTFAFGHVVGEGIQNALIGMSEQDILFNLFMGWHADTEDRNEKQNKSIYAAVSALQRFMWMREHGLLENYDLVYWNGCPAVEFSFRIKLPNGYKLRGFIDAVLRHKVTGEVLVLECKTTSLKIVDPALYKNSAQAIGYSIVLDLIFPELSSYKVLYLVYQTTEMSYVQFPFTKTYLQRAQWIQEMVHDTNTIQMYDESGIYPMRGESCYDFGRPCEYFSTCTLATAHLTKPCPPEDTLDTTQYTVDISFEELIEAQIRKTAAKEGSLDIVGDENPNAVPLMEGDNLL